MSLFFILNKISLLLYDDITSIHHTYRQAIANQNIDNVLVRVLTDNPGREGKLVYM
jgi:hypothetical protein